MNNEVFKDDKQIVYLSAVKTYTKTPRTEIGIQERK